AGGRGPTLALAWTHQRRGPGLGVGDGRADGLRTRRRDMPAPRRSVRQGGGASKLPHRQANGPLHLPPADGGRSLVEPAARSADAFIQHAGKLLRPAERLGERRPDGGTEITAGG